MRFRGTRVSRIAVGTALCLSVYAGPPAYSERQTQNDPARDLVRFTRNDSQVPATGTMDMDVRRTTVTHAKRRVIIRLRIADLRASTSHYSLSSIRTDELTYGVEFYRLFGADGRSRLLLFDDSDERLRCPGRNKRYLPGRDVLVLSFPRQCLGNPRWVRVSSGWYTIGNRDRIFGDDPRHVGGLPEDQGHNYSPRVRHG